MRRRRRRCGAPWKAEAAPNETCEKHRCCVCLPQACQAWRASHGQTAAAVRQTLEAGSKEAPNWPTHRRSFFPLQAFSAWRENHAQTAAAVRRALEGGSSEELRGSVDKAQRELASYFQLKAAALSGCTLFIYIRAFHLLCIFYIYIYTFIIYFIYYIYIVEDQ